MPPDFTLSCNVEYNGVIFDPKKKGFFGAGV
jgi:hypothetical protein